MVRSRIPCPPKSCAWCQKPLQRRTYNGRLEDRGVFLRRKYCDMACMGQARTTDAPTLGTLRSRHRKIVKRANVCQACGGRELLGIHHLDENPANNAPENVTTLCASCHTQWHWEHGKAAAISPPCSVCGQKSRRHGMCQKHFFRWKKYGDPLLTKRSAGPGRFCLVRVSPHE